MSDNLERVSRSWANFFTMLPNVLILLIIAGAVYFGYQVMNRMEEQTQTINNINTSLVSLGNTVGKVDILYTDKNELKKFISDEISKSIRDSGGTVNRGTMVTGKVPRYKPSVVTPTKTEKGSRIILRWPENKSGETLAIGEATYKDGEFTSETYPIEFHINVVDVTDKEGKESTLATLIAQGDTTEYSIEIKELKTVKQYPKEKSWYFAPHIDVGPSVRVGQGQPGIGVSVGATGFAYGLTPDDNVFRAPRLGIAFNETNIWAEVQAGYNFGKPVPLLSDAWVYAGPCIDISSNMGGCVSVTSTW